MKPLYALLFRFIQWYAMQLDRVAFWLYLHLIEVEADDPEDDTAELAQRDNSVHLPRRELH